MTHFTYLRKDASNRDHFYTPYQQASHNTLYNLLFCDDWNLCKEHFTNLEDYPLNQLFDTAVTNSDLVHIVDDKHVESRLRLLAYNLLKAKYGAIPHRELLGIIVEVHMDEGLDMLAVYADNLARYINYSGQVIIWENTQHEQFNQLKAKLFDHSVQIINQIGPWEQKRLTFPAKDKTRLTFLMSDGLYFGEGPTQSFFGDPLAAPALGAAVEILNFLTTFGTEA